jgi:hypothetical protein
MCAWNRRDRGILKSRHACMCICMHIVYPLYQHVHGYAGHQWRAPAFNRDIILIFRCTYSCLSERAHFARFYALFLDTCRSIPLMTAPSRRVCLTRPSRETIHRLPICVCHSQACCQLVHQHLNICGVCREIGHSRVFTPCEAPSLVLLHSTHASHVPTRLSLKSDFGSFANKKCSNVHTEIPTIIDSLALL